MPVSGTDHDEVAVLTRGRLTSKPRPGWDRVKQDVWRRAMGHCEVILDDVRCPERAQDVHHVVPRSHFGANRRDEADAESNLACVCRSHHDMAAAAYYKGRLRFVTLTPTGWRCDVVQKPSKWGWA